MLFSIDYDRGGRIEGWIMPDHPARTPRVRLVFDAEDVGEIAASVLRPLLREQGLHETGVCGFVIDERTFPGLREVDALEIYDVDTNVRIYRRPPHAYVEGKLFRLETQLLRHAALNDVFEKRFHMAFTRLEMLPEETVKSILGLPFSESVYATGRLHLPTYGPLLRDRGFRLCLCLRDPFEELAETLLLLAWAAGKPREALGGVLPNAHLSLRELIEPDIVKRAEAIEAWLVGLSGPGRRVLSDPLARLLTCRDPDERLAATAVADALDELGAMETVGFRRDIGRFVGMVGAIVGTDLVPIEAPAPARHLADLAERLREMDAARQLVEADCEIYGAANAAWERARLVPDH